ncbi:hypothetical protein PF008_g28054 [Phytophthora fragariae]|nr:hypothetical protein PF008_g28054 [Phytophthora fragariae]
MKDRRKFMADYETYLAAINTLQTQWAGVLVIAQNCATEQPSRA